MTARRPADAAEGRTPLPSRGHSARFQFFSNIFKTFNARIRMPLRLRNVSRAMCTRRLRLALPQPHVTFAPLVLLDLMYI